MFKSRLHNRLRTHGKEKLDFTGFAVDRMLKGNKQFKKPQLKYLPVVDTLLGPLLDQTQVRINPKRKLS